MAQDERLQAAEAMLARERMRQEMRANALASEKAARRRLLMVCVPLGSVLGGMFGALGDGSAFFFSLAGAGFGWIAAVLIARWKA
jgi:hypothetical protein